MEAHAVSAPSMIMEDLIDVQVAGSIHPFNLNAQIGRDDSLTTPIRAILIARIGR